METRIVRTTCCIAGGGPAGIMLGFLLARNGIDVTVLEKWPDFFRDFRGDTIHPSTMQVLRELGLLEKFLALPHNETKEIAAYIGGTKVLVADFTHLKTVPPFIAFIPQWDFLNFIAAEAKQYPSFHLLMETEAIDVIREGDRVVGVSAKDKEGEFEIHADLTVGADGRHSTIREKAQLPLEETGAPIDVLWFSIPRTADGTQQSLGYVDKGALLILIDRDTYWQCGFIIQKGSFELLKEKGLDAFQKSIADLVPQLSESVRELKDWNQVKLLSIAVDHLTTWYQPGLVCIGDSAHAMSPVGGVGINLAIQDAVASANILVPAFARAAGVQLSDVQAIQKRRMWPARSVQKIQVFLHEKVVARALAEQGHAQVPWQLRVLNKVAYLRRIPARVVGIGFRPEHIHTSI